MKEALTYGKGVAHSDDGTAWGNVDQGLPVGESVDVVVSQSPVSEWRSVVDILDEAPGGLVIKTAADVAAYLKEEKESWGGCAASRL